MTFELWSVVSDAERRKCPTLSILSENDVENIWTNVSLYIKRQMSINKGVHIPGLGTFTLSVQKLDVGHKYILIQRPIFILSERLAKCYGLAWVKAFPTSETPVVQLNYAALTVESLFDRDQVEGCVRDTMLLFRRVVSKQGSFIFPFHNIGLLSVCYPRVRMKFYREFVTAMDGTGQVLLTFSNRLGGNNLSGVSQPASTCPQLYPETEMSPISSTLEPRGPVKAVAKMEGPQDGNEQNITEGTIKDNSSIRRPSIRKTLQTAKVSGMCLNEDLEIPTSSLTSPAVSPFSTECKTSQGDVHKDDYYVVERKEKEEKTKTCEGQPGQTLCHICVYRAHQNDHGHMINVNMAEKRQREEEETEMVLSHNEQLKAQQYMLREKAAKALTRESNQKVAAFNLGVTEASKEHAAVGPVRLQGSYLFKGRPESPPRLPKQRLYLQELLDQADRRRKGEQQTYQMEDLIDRLCHVQMADNLKDQQDRQQQKEKYKTYKSSLEAQLAQHSEEVSSIQPDTDEPPFGLNDNVPQALAEQKQKAREVYLHQLQTFDHKRNHAKQQKASEQKKEMEIINRTKTEMVKERLFQHDKHRLISKALEESWRQSMEAKNVKDLEESIFYKSHGHLRTALCAGLQRCQQCKRRASNRGSTNLWKETRYVNGSKFMT